MTTEPRAFDGVNVLDFTQGVAGPHATMLLVQHGANGRHHERMLAHGAGKVCPPAFRS